MEAYIGGISDAAEKYGEKSIIVFFSGCDFKCPSCFVPEYLEFKSEFLVSLKDIKKAIKDFNPNFVVFSGGEPCLQRLALVELARYCKEIGMKTGVETNGSRPESIKSLLREKLIDFVAIDLKSPFDNFSFERTTRSQNFFRTSSGVVSNLKETFRLLKESNVDVEVRTTIIPEFMFTEYDLLQLASIVDESKFRWVFQSFISENKELVDKKFKAMGSPTEQLMNSLKEACLKKHPQLLIEIK